LIPSNRIAPAAANAFASLNNLAPGRIDFGVGSGFTGRRAMGLGAVKLADMETYVGTVMALLRGETTEAEIEGKRRLIRLLNPELGLINIRDPIGLYVAAAGPRAQALMVKLGAGWINNTAVAIFDREVLAFNETAASQSVKKSYVLIGRTG
jgi:5,10-methylenetetrahydromethanopterin reductase